MLLLSLPECLCKGHFAVLGTRHNYSSLRLLVLSVPLVSGAMAPAAGHLMASLWVMESERSPPLGTAVGSPVPPRPPCDPWSWSTHCSTSAGNSSPILSLSVSGASPKGTVGPAREGPAEPQPSILPLLLLFDPQHSPLGLVPSSVLFCT